MAAFVKIVVPDGVVMGEVHGEDVAASFPRTVFGPWNFAVPLEHVGSTIVIFDGLGNKTERMIAAPLLSLFFESVDDQFVNLFLLHQNIIDPPN